MAVIIQGNSSVNGEVEYPYQTLRVVTYPPNIDANGAYSISAQTGILSAVVDSASIGAFRWTHASKFCIITRVEVLMQDIIGPTGGGSEQDIGAKVYIARNFTASLTGGTAATLTGNNCKKRTSFATTQLGDFRMSTTTALSGGTFTLDSNPIIKDSMKELTRTNTRQHSNLNSIWKSNGIYSCPIILVQNEGLILSLVSTQANELTSIVTWNIDWMEVNSYPPA